MRFGPVGIWEILIILVVVLLIFGPRRLPEMAKGLGQSVREFRKGIRDMKADLDSDGDASKSAASGTSTPSAERAQKAEPQPQAEAPSTEPRRDSDTGA